MKDYTILGMPPAVFAFLAGLVLIPMTQGILVTSCNFPSLSAGLIGAGLTATLSFLLTAGVAYKAVKQEAAYRPGTIILIWAVYAATGAAFCSLFFVFH